MKDFKVAVCQIKPVDDKQANIAHAVGLIRDVADRGAELVVLPEVFYYPYEMRALNKIADRDSGTLDTLRRAAQASAIHVCTGSLVVEEDGKLFNRAYLISPNGEVVLEYSKAHLFDVTFRDLSVRESRFIAPGNTLSVAETPLGRIGMLICFDIRFPEMARQLAIGGAEIILVPAAFNTVTGPAHWHLMFRARAAENQTVVVAASQGRVPGALYEAYGHSMVVDAWGTVLAEAGEDEEVIYADLSGCALEETRGRMPLLSQRRPELYTALTSEAD